MPVSFENFQLVLAAVMVAGLLILLLPLGRITTHARLPRLSVVLVLVPLINVLWLYVAARALTSARQTREGA